jgi:uncharacterized membrane protein
MLLLILGLALWFGGHFFKRVLPTQRAAMGDAGKGVAALVILAGLILMVVGYRGADFMSVWSPPAFMTHLNNVLMVAAAWFFITANLPAPKVWPASKMRHPMLISVKIWAIAHLLVNGDLASLLLFGGLLLWAVLSVIMINKAEPDWTRPETAGGLRYAIVAIFVLLFVFGMTYVHSTLGVWPFPS